VAFHGLGTRSLEDSQCLSVLHRRDPTHGEQSSLETWRSGFRGSDGAQLCREQHNSTPRFRSSKKMHHLRLITKLLLQPQDQMDFESTTDQTDWARQIFKLLNSRAVRCGGRTVWRQGTSTPLRVKGTGAWFDRFVRSIRLLIEWTCSCLLACSCHTIFRDHSTLCMVEPNERW
jgi:hypothetical protein